MVVERFECVCNRSRRTVGGCSVMSVVARSQISRWSQKTQKTQARNFHLLSDVYSKDDDLPADQPSGSAVEGRRANGTSARKLGLHVAMFPHGSRSRVLRHRVCQNMMRAKASLGRSSELGGSSVASWPSILSSGRQRNYAPLGKGLRWHKVCWTVVCSPKTERRRVRYPTV